MTEYCNENGITDCRFEEKAVGKAIKMTKTKYRWEFRTNGKEYHVELYDSRLSGKKKIMANGQNILPAKVCKSPFSYSFYLGTAVITIVQNGATFECRINNLPFNHLLSLQKNKNIYCKEGASPTSNVYKSAKIVKEHPAAKFQMCLNENKENENLTINKAYNFTIKDKRASEKDDTDLTPEDSKFHLKKLDKFNSATGAHSVSINTNEDLLEFDDKIGTRPSKINVLDVSPLKSFKNDKAVEVETPYFLDQDKGKKTNQNYANGDKNNREITNLFDFNFANELQGEASSKKNISNLNDLFDAVNLNEPKEVSKIDIIKEVYNNTFSENEVSKIDPIYNLFGGPSFQVYSPYLQVVAKSPTKLMNFNLNQNYFSTNASNQESEKKISPTTNFNATAINYNEFRDKNKIFYKPSTKDYNFNGEANIVNTNNEGSLIYPSFADMTTQLENLKRSSSGSPKDKQTVQSNDFNNFNKQPTTSSSNTKDLFDFFD